MMFRYLGGMHSIIKINQIQFYGGVRINMFGRVSSKCSLSKQQPYSSINTPVSSHATSFAVASSGGAATKQKQPQNTNRAGRGCSRYLSKRLTTDRTRAAKHYGNDTYSYTAQKNARCSRPTATATSNNTLNENNFQNCNNANVYCCNGIKCNAINGINCNR